MDDTERRALEDLMKEYGVLSNWQWKDYPSEPLVDDDGVVEGCYRTPPTPTG